jgi:hypothetical protein
MANKFYTIVDLNLYKKRFEHGTNFTKDDYRALTSLKDTFTDNRTEQTTNIPSNNNAIGNALQGFFDTPKIGSTQNLQSFELKGRTAAQNQIPNSLGTFQQTSQIHSAINKSNNVGFGFKPGGQYDEFGNQMMPGNQSKLNKPVPQRSATRTFVKGLKGAQGGSGGGGGGRNHAVRKKGGGGGAGGGSYSAWVYPIPDTDTDNTPYTVWTGSGTTTEGGGGGAGSKGKWGHYSGENGGGGGNGGTTSFTISYNDKGTPEYKAIGTYASRQLRMKIPGGSGGQGGEKGKYNENGHSGGAGNSVESSQVVLQQYISSDDAYVDYTGGNFGFIISNAQSGVAGVDRRGYGEDGRTGNAGNGGDITDDYYLIGSNDTHKNTPVPEDFQYL